MRKLKACPTYQRLRCLSGAASTPSTVLVAASAEKTRAVEVVKKGSDGADGGSHVSQRCGVQHFACAALLSADKTIFLVVDQCALARVELYWHRDNLEQHNHAAEYHAEEKNRLAERHTEGGTQKAAELGPSRKRGGELQHRRHRRSHGQPTVRFCVLDGVT